MKSKIKMVHINGVEWTYAISNKEVRIYKPGTKQILQRVNMDDLPEIENDTATGIGPARVKIFIENNLIVSGGGEPDSYEPIKED